LSQPADGVVVDGKTVKLVAVDGQMPLAGIVPFVLLIHGNAHQVRHDFRQPVVVIAFHPHYFHSVLGVGKLADVAEKLPVLLGQTPEVEVGKDVTQQDQPLELDGLQKLQGIPRPADVRA